MSRFTLDQEIKLVQDEMLLLGSLAEQAILNAVDALRRRVLLLQNQFMLKIRN